MSVGPALILVTMAGAAATWVGNIINYVVRGADEEELDLIYNRSAFDPSSSTFTFKESALNNCRKYFVNDDSKKITSACYHVFGASFDVVTLHASQNKKTGTCDVEIVYKCTR